MTPTTTGAGFGTVTRSAFMPPPVNGADGSSSVLVFGWMCTLCGLDCPPRYSIGVAELLVLIHDRVNHNDREVAYLTASEVDATLYAAGVLP